MTSALRASVLRGEGGLAQKKMGGCVNFGTVDQSQMRTGGSKNPKILRTSYMDGP